RAPSLSGARPPERGLSREGQLRATSRDERRLWRSPALGVASEAVRGADALHSLVELFAVGRWSVGAWIRPLVARKQLRVLVTDEPQIELLDVRRQPQGSGREVRGAVLARGRGDGFDGRCRVGQPWQNRGHHDPGWHASFTQGAHRSQAVKRVGGARLDGPPAVEGPGGA